MLVLIPTAGKNSFTSSVPFSAILNLCTTQFYQYPVQSVNNVLRVYTFALNCRKVYNGFPMQTNQARQNIYILRVQTKWRPTQAHLIISCSFSSSSCCLLNTSSICFLSASSRWERSGIGGREGRLLVVDIMPELIYPPVYSNPDTDAMNTLDSTLIYIDISNPDREKRLSEYSSLSTFFFSILLPRYSHYQNCMIFILSNDLQLVENVIVEIICEISVIYFATLTMRHLLNIYVKTANHLPGCS